MSSPFYTPTGNPQSLTRGASPLIRSEFALIDQGFQKLPVPAAISGGYCNYLVDNGIGNAYNVTAPSVVTTLVDGLTFIIKFANANTGPSTITLQGVTGGSAIPIVRPDGSALASGDLLAGEIVQCSYSATMGKFQLSVSSATAVAAAASSAQSASNSASSAASSATSAQNYAQALNGTSATAVTIATGSKTFTASTGKQWVAGGYLQIASSGTPANFMFGQVTSYNSGTGALVMNITATGGSGSPSDWVISLSAALPTTPATLDITGQNPNKGTTGGTSTAYTLTPATPISAYTAAMKFAVTFNAASGDQPTLQISGVATPPNLVKLMPDGTYANIRTNDIPAGHRSDVLLLSATQAWVVSLPVNPSAGNYNAQVWGAANLTFSYADNGAMYEHDESAGIRAGTIASGLPAGWSLTIVNAPGASNVTIAPTGTDSLIWAGSGSTGTRTLAANGIATITRSKTSATRLYISGTNLT